MARIIEQKYYGNHHESDIKPIVYTDRGYEKEAISISQWLSEKLAAISSPKMRSMRMEQCLTEIIRALPEHSVIKDFDAMFNPQYSIDVLAVLKNVCKKHDFSVVWPGYYANGYLYYAEEGYADYKSYNLSNYDITCII